MPVASADVSELVKRLTSYSEALDRNVTVMQQAFDKVQGSFANLRRVWGGDAADAFYSDWMQTADGLEQTFETGRRLRALLDERLASLRMADRPFDEAAARAGERADQMRISFPLSPKDQEGLNRLEALRRTDAIPLLNEEGGLDFTRAILDIAGASVPGRSEGKHMADIDPPPPGVNPVAMFHAEANAITQARRRGLKANTATLYVDQDPCPYCKPHLRRLARWLGVERLRVVTTDSGVLGEY